MAQAVLLYGNVVEALADKEIDWLADTIKLALTTSTYTPDQDADNYFDDVTNEVVGTGYTAGGETLTTKALTQTGGSNLWTFDADNVSWTSSTITARWGVLYDDTPATDATKPLIAYVDFEGDLVSSNGTFAVNWNASGIFTATYA